MSESDDGNLPQTAEHYSPEDWLTASEAQRLVITTTLSRSANITICTRAHAGLIRAHADLMIIGSESRADQLVHKEFWWVVKGVVPEPGTWALMILGFGGAGAMLRRRNTVTA